MPYTQEELQKLDFYQNLIDEDEQQYLQRRRLLRDAASISGSADDGSLVLRNEEGTVMIFENPYTNELYEKLYNEYPYIPDFLYTLVQAYSKAERRSDAVEALETWLFSHPNDSQAVEWLSILAPPPTQ